MLHSSHLSGYKIRQALFYLRLAMRTLYFLLKGFSATSMQQQEYENKYTNVRNAFNGVRNK